MAALSEYNKHASDEAEVIRQLRAIRREGGGSGYGEIRVPVADDRVQVVEVTRKVKPGG